MMHEAIYKSHVNIVRIVDSDSGVTCYDGDNNIVIPDQALVAIEQEKINQRLQEIEDKKRKDELKLIGVEFEGVMCSATAEDQNGLLAVQSWVGQGGSTNFKFENGNKLLITPDNIADFSAVWMSFRQGFFND